jgi:hypothetical protein
VNNRHVFSLFINLYVFSLHKPIILWFTYLLNITNLFQVHPPPRRSDGGEACRAGPLRHGRQHESAAVADWYYARPRGNKIISIKNLIN